MFNYNNKKITAPMMDEYQNFLAEEKIVLARILCLLGFVLYGSFAIVDYFALKSVFNTALMIRFFVMTTLLIGYASTYTDKFLKYYKSIQIVLFVVSIAGVEAMIYLASPSDQAYSTYYAGLIIIMITLFSWSHLTIIYSGLLALGSLLGYLYIETYVRDFIANDTYATVITNIFIYSSAIIFGLTAQAMRDSHLRKNFFLQRSLQNAYDRKSIEAKDNEYLANHDALTDLPNRRYLTELLTRSLEIAAETNKVLVVMFIDLNGFKQVNDVYGHNAGDEVLTIVAKRLELAIRDGDNLSRIGGDEYVMGLMMDKESLDEIETMANKFIDIISQPMNVDGLRVRVGASVGVAAYPIHGNSIEALIEIADQRMYQAKRRKSEFSFDADPLEADKQEAVVFFPGNAKKK